MKLAICLALVIGQLRFAAQAAETTIFADSFQAPPPQNGWTWLREDSASWRVSSNRLEMRIHPGNLWGGANNAINVLTRPVPHPEAATLQIFVTVENKPVGQYEQADLAWYYDDSHMVKLGQEKVDGKLCVVMGREQANRTRTLGIHPLPTSRVHLRLTVDGQRIMGHFQPDGDSQWHKAGEADLPVPANGKPKVSLHCYQGLPDVEHWARFSDFRILQISK